MHANHLTRLKLRAFTLVELLIVVIILAILAAIIVPQFSSATVDAQETSLDANLAALRSSIELYHAQHGTLSPYPGAAATSGGTCATVKGTGAANSAQAFIDSMLMYSDVSGNTCNLGDATTYKFGPYLRKGVPADPITGKGSIAADIVVTSAGTALAPAAATGGWAYDAKSGQIVMNSNANDSKTKVYSTH
jgi:general secretion pathway protein G